MWYLCVSLTEELLGFIGGDHSILHSHQQCRRDPVSPCPHPTVLIPMAKGCGLQARASDFLATCLMTRGGQCDGSVTHVWSGGRSGPSGAEDGGPHKAPPQQELPALGAPLAASVLGGGSGMNPLELSTHPLCSSSPQWIGHPPLTPGSWKFLSLAPFSSLVLKVRVPGPFPQIRGPQGSPGVCTSSYLLSVGVWSHPDEDTGPK